MEKVFNVKWQYLTQDVGDKFLNVHFNAWERTKLLIHTNQLSYYSNELLEQIAVRVRRFIIEDLHQENIYAYLKG